MKFTLLGDIDKKDEGLSPFGESGLKYAQGNYGTAVGGLSPFGESGLK